MHSHIYVKFIFSSCRHDTRNQNSKGKPFKRQEILIDQNTAAVEPTEKRSNNELGDMEALSEGIKETSSQKVHTLLISENKILGR